MYSHHCSIWNSRHTHPLPSLCLVCLTSRVVYRAEGHTLVDQSPMLHTHMHIHGNITPLRLLLSLNRMKRPRMMMRMKRATITRAPITPPTITPVELPAEEEGEKGRRDGRRERGERGERG